MDESPDEDVLDQAASAALLAEVAYARARRRAVLTLPAEDQVKRLIAAAWPVLAGDDLYPCRGASSVDDQDCSPQPERNRSQ
jgi:hypothetical protein